MAMLERVAYLEGQVNEQSQAFVALRESLGRFEQRVDARFDALDGKMSHQFLWMIGIQITILLAVLGAVFSRP